MKELPGHTALRVFNLMIGVGQELYKPAGTMSYYHAKRCALLHCEEMIALHESSYNIFTKYIKISHWKQVKDILNEYY